MTGLQPSQQPLQRWALRQAHEHGGGRGNGPAPAEGAGGPEAGSAPCVRLLRLGPLPTAARASPGGEAGWAAREEATTSSVGLRWRCPGWPGSAAVSVSVEMACKPKKKETVLRERQMGICLRSIRTGIGNR